MPIIIGLIWVVGYIISFFVLLPFLKEELGSKKPEAGEAGLYLLVVSFWPVIAVVAIIFGILWCVSKVLSRLIHSGEEGESGSI